VEGSGVLGDAGRERLPAPARRWLDRAAPAGAGAPARVELWTRGEIRLGRWRSLRARQVLVPGRGFVWAARVGRRPVAITGFDRYAAGRGELRWRLAGLVTVMAASGPDIDRSAAGRLAAESVLLPPSLLDPAVAWEGLDGRRAVATLAAGPWSHEVTIAVDADGVLREVSLPRWGAPGDTPRQGVFRVALEGEVRDAGVAVCAAMTAGWDGDPDGPFLRCAVDAVRVR
jgi:hypothetical protein